MVNASVFFMKMIQVGVEYGNFVVRIFAHSPPEELALRSTSGKCEPIFAQVMICRMSKSKLWVA